MHRSVGEIGSRRATAATRVLGEADTRQVDCQAAGVGVDGALDGGLAQHPLDIV